MQRRRRRQWTTLFGAPPTCQSPGPAPVESAEEPPGGSFGQLGRETEVLLHPRDWRRLGAPRTPTSYQRRTTNFGPARVSKLEIREADISSCSTGRPYAPRHAVCYDIIPKTGRCRTWTVCVGRTGEVKSPSRLVHLAYWTGAVVDGAMVLPLLAPSVAATMLGINGFAPGSDYRYVAGLCAALMAGWTVLLAWGRPRPIARRGVLLLTVCPVVLGLAAAGGYALHSGLVRPLYLAPTLAVQFGVAVLFLAAYRRAKTWPLPRLNRADLMVLVNFREESAEFNPRGGGGCFGVFRDDLMGAGSIR